MKTIYRLGLPSLLLTTTLLSPIAYADDGADPNAIGDNTKSIADYLQNLGSYLGFDVTKAPQTTASPSLLVETSTLLLSSAGNQTFLQNVLYAFVGAIPVNALFKTFVPQGSAYETINSYANAALPSYASTQSSTSSPVTVNPMIDQQPYMQDPVSQGILNILGTPNYTYCMDKNTNTWSGAPPMSSGGGNKDFPDCVLQYNTKVMGDVLGSLPNALQVFTADYNQQFLSQLNSNNLIAPLVYSTTSSSSTGGSSGGSPQPQPQGKNSGLQAASQAEQAANFIRYVTSAVVPVTLPQYTDYSNLYMAAMATGATPNTLTQVQAQATLASYLTKLRVYAAQTSVAYSNLYYILSKRMPQGATGADSSSQTSQALNEFTMATWRLYNPSGTANPQWLNQINSASTSTATVQKEMAQLLAEINYQLYLTRQQQERLLITNTMLLLLSARSSLPPTTNLSASINNPN